MSLALLDKFIVSQAKKKAGMKDEDKDEWDEEWGDKEDWEHDEKKDHWIDKEDFQEYMEEWKFWVQAIFAFIAFANAAKLGMDYFRYRDHDYYYMNGKIGGAEYNWWKVGNDWFLGGAFYIMATAFVTQMLALFGIAPKLNQMVW
jgi:hypothetical protein